MAKKLGPGPTHNANAGLRQGLQLLLAIGSVGFYGRSLTLLITPLGEDGYDEVGQGLKETVSHNWPGQAFKGIVSQDVEWLVCRAFTIVCSQRAQQPAVFNCD